MTANSPMASSSQQQQQLHRHHHRCLVLPHAQLGHITPLLHFCYKLAASYHVSITFVVPQHLLPSALQVLAKLNHDPASNEIQILGLQDGLPLEHPRQQTFLDTYQIIMSMRASVETFLQDLPRSQIPTFVLVDTFVTWGYDLALKHAIPSVAFATTNATAVAVMSSISKLIHLGLLPLKTINGSSKFSNDAIDCIPGVLPLSPNDLPVSFKSSSISDYRLQYIKSHFEEASKAVALLVNTVYELEKSAVDGLQFKVPTYTVGPALLYSDALLTASTSGSDITDGCVSWLNKQAPASVLYVSFGSMADVDASRIAELSLGLEASQQPFLWVMRSGSPEDILPEGFLERSRNRCLIVQWAPQLQVLSHEAVGGFLTHCGWNSVLENICLGAVPMICWPQGAEQGLNAKVIVDVWQVGLRLLDHDGCVQQDQIAAVAKRVLLSEEMRHLKTNAIKMRTLIKSAIQSGGSSLTNIQNVLDIVSKQNESNYTYYN